MAASEATPVAPPPGCSNTSAVAMKASVSSSSYTVSAARKTCAGQLTLQCLGLGYTGRQCCVVCAVQGVCEQRNMMTRLSMRRTLSLPKDWAHWCTCACCRAARSGSAQPKSAAHCRTAASPPALSLPSAPLYTVPGRIGGGSNQFSPCIVTEPGPAAAVAALAAAFSCSLAPSGS